MHTKPEGETPSPTDTGSPAGCAGCEAIREEGGSTCGDCGTFPSLVPPAAGDVDRAPELLEQLVAGAGARCLYCPDPILAGDMFVGWALLGIIAHFACYATAQNLARPVSNREARS